MRLISGRLGGRRLLGPPRETPTRPTSDRVREAIFSILGDRVVGADVLDLFAGTGAFGLEALSRGARRATFVERDRRVADVLRRNIEALGLAAQTEVHVADLEPALGRIESTGAQFHLMFADPPYASDEAVRCLTALASSSMLAPGGWVIVEHAARSSFAQTYRGPAGGRLDCLDKRRWGDTAASMFARGPDAPKGPARP